MEVGPQLSKTSPGPECLPPEEGQLLPPDIPLEQHYVSLGEGQPLPSKDVRREPQQGKRVPVAITESPGVNYIPLGSETIFAWGDDHCRHIRLGERVPRHEAFVATFPPAQEISSPRRERPLPPQAPLEIEALVARGRAVSAAAGCPHRSRTRSTGTDRLGKGEIVEDRSSATDVVCKGTSGSGTFATGGRAATNSMTP